MVFDFNKNKEELYQDFLEEEARKGCLTISLLGAILFPVLVPLDYYTQREHFSSLFIIRFSISLIFFILYLTFRKGIGLRKPFLAGNFILVLASGAITLMCMVMGGMQSSYYAGVNLVIMAAVLILPSGRQTIINIGIVIGIYLLGVFIESGFRLTHPQHLVFNLHILALTGVIGATASHFKDRIRRESFYRYLEIQRSVGVLQRELESSHGNMESLTHEIVSKKTEVQGALELRDRFISIASHELRTPLTGMKLQLEVGKRKIEGEGLDKAQMKKLLQSADSELRRIIRIVDEMLDVSRIQSGKFVFEKKETDVNQLVTEIASRYYSEQVKTGKIHLHIPDIPSVNFCDPYKIEQVILNLINNALLYGGEGEISISVAKENGEIIVTVQDQGTGIASENQERIFEKFERNDSKNNLGGLGLGLYISKQIIEGHGGRIYLISEMGKGSRFIFHLPLSES